MTSSYRGQLETEVTPTVEMPNMSRKSGILSSESASTVAEAGTVFGGALLSADMSPSDLLVWEPILSPFILVTMCILKDGISSYIQIESVFLVCDSDASNGKFGMGMF